MMKLCVFHFFFFSTDTNKIAQVILERMSLAQRLSGSPLKKNSKVPVVVNKMKRMKKQKKTTITSSNGYDGNSEGKEKENSDSSEDTSNNGDVIGIKRKRITKLGCLMFPSSSSSSDDNDAKENIDTSNENNQVR